MSNGNDRWSALKGDSQGSDGGRRYGGYNKQYNRKGYGSRQSGLEGRYNSGDRYQLKTEDGEVLRGSQSSSDRRFSNRVIETKPRWSRFNDSSKDRAALGEEPLVLRKDLDVADGKGERNPHTGRNFSRNYYQLLELRKKLPIYNHRDEVLKIVGENKFVVLVGDTGSGKTTQVPQILSMKYGKENNKLIACTQPRRIAAVTVAQRVAEEMDVRLGDEVGYSIRYEDETSSRTILKYCTDGLLLRESVTDPLFSKYSMIIIDEAHERTISTDILMGMLKQVVFEREDFRLVVMSATLDAEKLQKYFNNAPLISIPGRMFPVDIKYLEEPVEDYLRATIEAVSQIHREEAAGDILVFLNGEDEISTAVKDLEESLRNVPGEGHASGVHVLPLFSSLPSNAIQKVFQDPPPNKRKIVLATNVAETSITIDGIVYVVDPGFAKQKVYNPRNRVESLQVAPVSAASAVQRSGRAGRTRAGITYRLYTEDAFESLTAMTYPEILRSNLNSVVLQLRTLSMNPVQFDFLDPPPPETVMRALECLLYLGALDQTGQVTKFGKAMSVFPLDPELSRTLLAAPDLGVAQEVLAIVAMVSAAPNCFVRPLNKAREADQAKRRFEAEESDHLTLLNVYTEYMIHNSSSQQWCWENFLNERALQSAAKAKEQLERLLEQQGYSTKSKRIGFDYYGQSIAIRKAITQGNFMFSAVECKRATYLTTKDNVEVKLHPSSGVRTRPTWLIYNELVITTKAFIRTVTQVEGSWLLESSPNYFTPDHFTNDVVSYEIAKLTGERKKSRSAMNTNLRQAY